MNHKIFIAGAGGIGQAAALLLREWADFEPQIFLGDVSEKNLSKARDLMLQNSGKTSAVETVLMPPEGISDQMKEAFTNCSVLLDCAPGGEAPRMARFAVDFKMHYANLTEYVRETDEIIELARDAETGFILQTGLAPGFINILAMSLYRQFVARFENEKVEKIGMKVGALTIYAHQPHFYGFTWSPIGVATEYVKNARAIRNYQITELPALSEKERIVIGGRTFEADLTSGGAADLPDFFDGKAKSLDYKTLRHVGHYDYAQRVIHEFPNDDDLPAKILHRFLQEIPAVEDDFVLVHASVEGFDRQGVRRRLEKAFFVEPLEINGNFLRAIQTTTAVPLLEAALMLLSNDYRGVILQSQIDPAKFLKGDFVSRVFKD